jgi:D-mannonate dehydratase
MAGDRSDSHPGYEALGKLFAMGYMKGLMAGL